MPVAYSSDLRVRIIEDYLDGRGTYQELADKYAVGVATVNRILRRVRESGDVGPRPPGGGNPPAIGPDQVKALGDLVAENSDATVQELTEAWRRRFGKKVSRSSMLRALHRFGFSVKKSPSALSRASERMSRSNASPSGS